MTGAQWAIMCVLLVSCTSISSSKSLDTGIRTALLHRNHYLSPFHGAKHSLKPEDRLAESVRRSIARIHHLERERHMITVQTPVSYAIEGAYIMNISLGTPPRSFLVVADTGSDVTWIQCRACFDCLKAMDSVFDPTESSTYRSLSCSDSLCTKLRRQGLGSCGTNGGCQYNLKYGDGSHTDGKFSIESLTVETTNRGSMVSNAYAFGCGNSNRSKFEGIDGVVGLGRGSLSFPSQISHFITRKFSYCLVDFWKASNRSSHLLFGSLAAENVSNMQFTTLVSNRARSTKYYVDMEDISVDGLPLHISPSAFQIKPDGLGGTFLDSGTTVTHLVRPAHKVLLSMLRSTVDYPIVDCSHLGLELCFNTTGITSPKFPSISLKFRGADLDLPSENAFISLNNEGTICLAILPSKKFNVIGSIQMQNFQFLYDVENSQIGFKREDCGRFY